MTAVITGYSSDIGDYITNQLLLRQEDVLLLGRTSPNFSSKYSSHVRFSHLDFLSISFESDLEKLKEEYKDLNIKKVIHIAATSGIRKPFKDNTYQEIIDIANFNLINTGWFIKTMCNLIQANQISDSSIVCISSQLAKFKGPGLAMYSATKASINSLCRTLAHEYGSNGIRINSISPGIVEGENIEGNRSYNQLGIALNRFAQPSDIWEAVDFLCSSKSSYITGADLVVNGGR